MNGNYPEGAMAKNGHHPNAAATGQTVRPELGARIVRLAHKYRTNGLEVQSLAYHYHREFLCELDLQVEGFQTIDELLDCLISREYPLEVLDGCDGICRVVSDKHRYIHWLSVIKMSRDYHLMDILADTADDVISCGHKLPEFQFPSSVVINGTPEVLSGNIINELNFSEVRLMSVRSPHDMYVHIVSDSHHYAYHRLQQDMRLYDLSDNQDKYRVPSLLLFDGLLCAVHYRQSICHDWYRCVLLSIDSRDKCRVYLVDIGDVIEVNAKHLRLLLRDFAVLPPQAVRVQLVGVRPDGPLSGGQQRWSQWAVNLVKRLEDKAYSARIECAFVDYRCDRHRVFIRYYDRIKSINNQDLVLLHQTLVDKQMAIITGNDMPIN